MTIAKAQPYLNLSVKLRPLQATKAEALPIDSVAGVQVQSAGRDTYQNVKNSFLEPSALSTVHLSFGSLDAVQFDTLKKEFGGLTQVPYVPGRSYEAADFLPPAMQALIGRDLEIPAEPAFIPGSSNWALIPWDEERVVDLTANCHGTSYEAVSAYQGQDDLDIFFGDPGRMQYVLEDSGNFAPVGGVVTGSAIDTSKLSPGDVVAFSNPAAGEFSDLLHTSVYAGGGLFFEKPDTEGSDDSDAPYRLATQDMVKKPIEHFLEGPVSAKVFRATAPLPKPEQAFGVELEQDVKNWETDQGRPLGMPLLTQLQLGIGGGIRGEGLTTLVDQPILLDATGRGAPVGVAS